MVKIRLRRIGSPKKPAYRVVITDSRAARNGAFISIIGQYDPMTNPETININEQEALKWLGQGAQPTVTVSRLLKKAGILDKFKATKEKS
ncbi:MAG: 30S ribosomal protein S16 [Dehalococcoidales bacterium]|jgi:small subunit ribosomal protein S16|nr:30S ribosomal protein S16 [Dehalococcoidales bacterium]